MNDGYDEQIFESFLEESLTNQRPPDLTELIQQRIREELGPERFQQLRAGGLRRGSQTITPTVIALAPTTTPTSESTMTGSSSISSRTAVSVALLTLAAGLLLAVSVWKFMPGLDKLGNFQASQIADNSGSANSPSAPVPVQPAVKPLPKIGQDLALENLPFSQRSPVIDQPQLADVYDPMPDELAAAPTPMSSEEINQWLDERFNKLWSDRQIAVSKPLDNAAVMVRMTSVLAGQNAAASAQTPAELADKLVRTVSFSESWSDRIAAYWLRGTSAADAKDPAGSQLRTYLAQQLVARKPWNEVLSEIVDATPEQPQSSFLVSLASADNHLLASRVGGVLLDEALACARCHDPSENGRVVSMDQDDYWSLVAIFTGVESQVSKPDAAAPLPVKKLVDKQLQLFENGKTPGVYFDRPDGRSQAARYRLPGGDYWRTVDGVKTPRQSLARWIANSTVTDKATVNLAWRLVFGRPLTAQHSVLDGEGYAQRREIVAKLAAQFHAHDRDFGLLVSWLVNSRPFAAPALDVDRARWLAADEQEIGRWGVSTTNFATFAPVDSQSAQLPTLVAALLQVEKWSGSRAERSVLLAQPTPDSVTRPKVSVPIQALVQEPPATYLIRSLKPTEPQSRYIARLVASKLSWPQQVDHVAGLIGESSGNAKLHSAAQKMLDNQNGDRAAALFQLLQSVLVCHESL